MRLALALVLAVAAIARGWVALTDDGTFWPDEIFQSLEPAHQRAFGYALLPWEFVVGARSWLLPMLLAPLLRLGAWLGGDRPRVYLVLVRFVFIAVAVATTYGVYLLSRKARAQPEHALVAAALYALLPPLVYFAPRATSENASALLLVFALWLLCDPSRARDVAGAGVLLGLAAVLRTQNLIVCAAAVGWLAARRRWRDTGFLLATLGACVLADGLFDRLTWGHWFASSRNYLVANYDGYSLQFGQFPTSYYLRALFSSSGVAGMLLLLLALVGAARAPGLALVAGLYFVVHSAVAYKSLRLALPILPVAAALAGVGLTLVADRAPTAGRRIAVRAVEVAAVLALGWGLVRLPRLTFADLGAHYFAGQRALDFNGEFYRRMLDAHATPDLCGLRMPDRVMGGMTWLHRHVPVYGGEASPAQHFYNYELRPIGRGRWKLARVGDSPCAPDPTYRYEANLPPPGFTPLSAF